MTLLTRYIGKRFLINFMSAAGLLTGLIFMIDFIELLRQSAKYKSVGFDVLLYIGMLRLPAYIELFLPFSALVATVGTYLGLSRSSELTVIRASGMSVWQFIRPCVILAFLIGLFGTLVFNPLAASWRGEAEKLRAEVFGKQKFLLHSTRGGVWLRQDGKEGASVLQSYSVAERGGLLVHPVFFKYDPAGKFAERIDAKRAVLGEGVWKLQDVWISRVGQAPVFAKNYEVYTYLTRTQITSSLGSIISISFWKLPGYIEQVERAGIKATRFAMQYASLLSRPLLLVVVVLLAATVSLRAFRFGKIQTMVITGMIAGFGFFLLMEISRQVGAAGLVPPYVAALVPLVVASSLSLTVLLHQEDG